MNQLESDVALLIHKLKSIESAIKNSYQLHTCSDTSSCMACILYREINDPDYDAPFIFKR